MRLLQLGSAPDTVVLIDCFGWKEGLAKAPLFHSPVRCWMAPTLYLIWAGCRLTTYTAGDVLCHVGESVDHKRSPKPHTPTLVKVPEQRLPKDLQKSDWSGELTEAQLEYSNDVFA